MLESFLKVKFFFRCCRIQKFKKILENFKLLNRSLKNLEQEGSLFKIINRKHKYSVYCIVYLLPVLRSRHFYGRRRLRAALKNAAPAPGSDQQQNRPSSGAALKVATPSGSGSATLPITFNILGYRCL